MARHVVQPRPLPPSLQVSVLHSVQAGFTDKALSYADKAMQFLSQEQCTATCDTHMHIRTLPCSPTCSPGSPEGGGSAVLQVLRTHVLEQSVQCLLMQGKTAAAAEKVASRSLSRAPLFSSLSSPQLQEAVNVCHGHAALVYSHRAVLHTLLVGPAAL